MFCAKCGVKADSASKFCGNCGTMLPHTDATEANPTVKAGNNPEQDISRRQMTVLFCDVVGSTSLAETMDAEDLFYALDAYHTLVKKIAAHYNGHVAKIVGDGVDLYFGYPIAGEDDVVRAVHAALEIVEEIEHLTDSDGKPINLQVRVGLATGRVTVGIRETISIAGSTPNLAARIQAEAQPGQVAVAPETRRIAGEQFAYVDLGMFALKGFSDEVRINAVTGAYAFESRSAWRGHNNMFPMVGRDTEMAELLRSWQNANAEHADHAVGILLLAEAGMGKSRLSTALADSLQDETHLTIRLQCSPFHSNTVLYPFLQHLTTAAGFRRTDSALIQVEKLESQMAIAGITQTQDLALIAALLDIKVDNRYPPLEMPPPAKLQMAEEVLLRYFKELASQIPVSATEASLMRYLKGINKGKPLLVLFDDLHWIDPSSLELLDKLLGTINFPHTLILMTARPGFKYVFNSDANLTPIALQKLEPIAARQMVVNLCSAIALSDAAIDQILKKTDGIPLYIEEMTRMVQDVQSSPAVGMLGCQSGVELGVPDTLLDLLMERLDRLGSAKKLVQVAAVLGQDFSQDLLAAVAQMEEGVFTDDLATVLDSDLLFMQGPNRLKFKHALVENTAYDSILLKSRVALHGRVVECLQGEFASLAQGTPQLLAHHLAHANRALDASRYLLQASVQALQGGAPREAAEHIKAGLTSLENTPADTVRNEVELALLSVLGPTTMVLMGPGNSAFGDVQKRAHALCHQLPGKPREFPITYGLCLYHWGRAEFEIAKPLAQKLLETANAIESNNNDSSEVSSDEAVMAACNMNGMIAFHMGESEQARSHLQRSIELYQPERDAALYPIYLMDFGIFGRFYLALACIACGDADIARQHALDAYTLAQKLNQPHSIGFSILANMTVAVQRDEPEVAQKFSEQCVEFSSQFGFPEFIAMARVVRGWAAAKLGHPLEGLEDLEAGFAQWQETGFENWQAWFTCLKADILHMLDRHEQALEEINAQLARIEINKELQFMNQLLVRKTTIKLT